ncbi:mucin 10, submandibular gland salivary mucin, isoform CRA_a [Mus musculus]|nr:mucin 10, submandibular gland salivary mucin, isoform CRA_a [Mus musculus]
MKNEMFILGLLALTSYFMPGESHHKSRSSQFPVRKYLEDPRYPRYPRPHYSYGFIPSSPKFPKDNQWYKMCPPGTTLMLISRRSPKFLCIPKRQIISDKTKPNATTPQQPPNLQQKNLLLHLSLAPLQPYLQQLSLQIVLPLLQLVLPSKLQLQHLRKCFGSSFSRSLG